MKAFECNTRTDSFRGSAAAVASVAVAWKQQGRDVGAYAIWLDAAGRITISEAAITTARATAAALRG